MHAMHTFGPAKLAPVYHTKTLTIVHVACIAHPYNSMYQSLCFTKVTLCSRWCSLLDPNE